MPKRKTLVVRESREEVELEIKQGKSNARIFMNTTLIGVAFTIFALLFALQTNFLTHNNIVTMQLVLAVPFLLISTMADSKLTYTRHEKHWESLGWASFIIGYAFLLNVVGLIVFLLIGLVPAALFFVVNIALMLTYSAVEISYNRAAFPRRIAKDLMFILMLFIFGIVPMLAMLKMF